MVFFVVLRSATKGSQKLKQTMVTVTRGKALKGNQKVFDFEALER
jgi:hypothetical protein